MSSHAIIYVKWYTEIIALEMPFCAGKSLYK